MVSKIIGDCFNLSVNSLRILIDKNEIACFRGYLIGCSEDLNKKFFLSVLAWVLESCEWLS